MSPSPTEKVATAAQYADRVNPWLEGIETWLKSWADACLFKNDPICSVPMITLDRLGQAVITALDGAAKPGVRAYIGKPPADIAKLVADTRAAADELDAAIPENFDVATFTSELYSQVSAALGELSRKFDEWQHYLLSQ
jgi:hypothetical protein